jgi:hypothetical protein
MTRLPKDIVAHERHDAIASLLSKNLRPLREGSQLKVATLSMNEEFTRELARALLHGHATQGLEAIEDLLAKEQKGLSALAKKTPDQPPRERISRLLLVTKDGSERFYHDCDSLVSKYTSRLICCRLDLSGEELGARVLPKPGMVRAILLHDKKALSRVLLTL